MKRLSVIIGIAALALTATAAPATASRGRPDQPVPIAGTMIGEHWIEAPEGCYVPEDALDAWRFSSEGTGQMSRLGTVEYVLTQCTYVDPASGPTSIGTVTFVAANGDELVVIQRMNGTLIFEEPGDMEPSAFTVLGTWDVDGAAGTGRFAGATGSGLLDGYGDIPDGVPYFDDLPEGLALFHFQGMIAYDASNRSR